jgi:hypothetical protein
MMAGINNGLMHRSKQPLSFDHLTGLREQHRRSRSAGNCCHSSRGGDMQMQAREKVGWLLGRTSAPASCAHLSPWGPSGRGDSTQAPFALSGGSYRRQDGRAQPLDRRAMGVRNRPRRMSPSNRCFRPRSTAAAPSRCRRAGWGLARPASIPAGSAGRGRSFR